MTILSGDIKLLAHQVMSDDPEGGGPPTANAIPDGASNGLFPDVSEGARAGGRIYIRQVSAAVQTPDRDVYMDANVIVAEPPNDPNVSITIMRAPSTFARRTAVANAIESYLTRGPLWGDYLLENHVANQRSIQLLQRPGAALPPIGRTLVLVSGEGTGAEVVEYVRTTKVESVTRTFTEVIGGALVDFQADVVTCSISSKLRNAFAGSPATRTYAAAPNKTIVRDTTVADAGSYCGITTLRAAGALGDTTLQVGSIYTQLVPNSRTESIALDQRPAAQRPLQLATAPREVSVSVSPHTRRIKVGQENRGFAWVMQLRPLPAPNTLAISYRALGNWYTVQDDGNGTLTGAGVGTVNYLTGSVALTLPSMPDVGSSIIYTWGEKTAFVNRSGQAGFRAPEFAIKLEHDNVKPGTLTATWPSGGVTKTATDAGGTGVLSGHGSGAVHYAQALAILRPTAMVDPGGEISISYETSTSVTKTVASPAVDAGGFITVALDDAPVPRSVSLRWVTVRTVSASSGATAAGTAKASNSSTTSVWGPPGSETPRPPAISTRVPITAPEGASDREGLVPGMYPWGTRALTGETVFVAVQPTIEGGSYGYTVPDSTDVTWDEQEFGYYYAKTLNTQVFVRWGFVARAGGGLTSV